MTESVATTSLTQETLALSGPWTVKGIAPLTQVPLHDLAELPQRVRIDDSAISKMDTAGAWLLHKVITHLKQQHVEVEFAALTPQHTNLLRLVTEYTEGLGQIPKLKRLPKLASLGAWVVGLYTKMLRWFYFTGEFSVTTLTMLEQPNRIRWKYFFGVIETAGYRALPIIGLLSFLIGVVLAYQIGVELRLFGANTFIVNVLGIAVFREFAPLITAIIMAGRTGSAFTAQIGLMKTNEEIDALRTMGLSPSELLVFPRILSLVIVLPLLTVWSGIFAIMGGMIMSNIVLDIGFYDFLNRFAENVSLTSFVIGLAKAPIFACIIAGVGCFQGLQVTGSSESLGAQTTKSVVLSIFLIIIADAIATILLSWWGL